MLLPVIDAPVRFEVGGPALVPRILADGARRRTQCEDIDEHPLIITDPIVRAEIAAFATFGIPAHRDRLLPATIGRRNPAVFALDKVPISPGVDFLNRKSVV